MPTLRSLAWLIALPWALGGCEALCPADSPEARDVIERAIAASGGKAGLQTLDRCCMRTKGISYNDAGQPTPFTFTGWQDLPARMCQETRLGERGDAVTIVTVVDGERGWRSVNGTTTPLPPAELQALRQSMKDSQVKYLHPLLEPPFHLALLPPTIIKGQPAVGVRVTTEGEPDRDLFFDRDTHVLVKYASREPDGTGSTHLREECYWDYQELGGLPWPMRKAVLVDGKLQAEREAIDFQPLDAHSPLRFTPP